ncbi:uncharacterized protein LOC124896638 [Capsicum annuum]|uniref:uncharacterized protein LOC124896638 n=1 Tax=Capsicum annuum TaxID=4072 RepID=UPI001FB14C35|nr:uncharacterized protein LOC124896638 [Capsicum annuum]
MANDKGAALLEFARAFGLVVVNSSFSKKKEHLVTFRSRVAKTQIDFLLLRKEVRALCKDCKVTPSENVATQHRLLVMDLAIKKGKLSQGGKGRPRFRESAREVLVISRGWSGRFQEDWWWNEDVNKKVKSKKVAYGDRGVVLGELELFEECRDFGFCRRFKVEEVNEAIRKMRRGRVMGLDEILVDFWKFSGGTELRWLTNLFNNIFKSANMSEAWR